MKTMITKSKKQLETPQYICFLISLLGILSTRVESLRFEVKSLDPKCFGEDIRKDSMTVGKYHIVNENEAYPLPDSHLVSATVMSSSGKNYHKSDNVTEGNFVFYAEEEGKYYICLFAPTQNPPITLTVEFEWNSGVIANQWSHVAKKDSVEMMELELKKMYDIVQSVHDEMTYLRRREMELQELNFTTTSKMAWFGLLSLGICISVTGLQFWHLKSFFHKRKLI